VPICFHGGFLKIFLDEHCKVGEDFEYLTVAKLTSENDRLSNLKAESSLQSPECKH